MSINFDASVRTTMGAATDLARGAPLDVAQRQQVADYLRSSGSGIDAHSSFEDFVRHHIEINSPRLPDGMDYKERGQVHFHGARRPT